jgi:hypothetical protein
MSDNKKPTPIIAEPGKKICPVCGKPSYSSAGVHPQCAVRQADASRQEEREAEETTTVKKPRQRSWEKKCPKCGAQIHVRRKACDCGHEFRGC